MVDQVRDWQIYWIAVGGRQVDSCHGFWSRCRAQFTQAQACLPLRDSDSNVLIVHYTGYGYASDGAPAWLAAALEAPPEEFRALTIVTFFHELYANGKIWQRSFWLSRRQKAVAIRIAKASDLLMTNRGESARWLESVSRRTPGSIPHVPICSTVGELDPILAWRDRPQQAITFGSYAFKKFALCTRAERTCRILTSLGIRELIDVGERAVYSENDFRNYGIHVKQLGHVQAESISKLMSESRLAFVDYNPEYLEKSSILAVCSAHGVPCAMPYPPPKPTASIQFISFDQVDVDAIEAMALRTWYEYRKRSASIHAKKMIDLINSCGGPN